MQRLAEIRRRLPLAEPLRIVKSFFAGLFGAGAGIPEAAGRGLGRQESVRTKDEEHAGMCWKCRWFGLGQNFSLGLRDVLRVWWVLTCVTLLDLATSSNRTGVVRI